MQKKTLKITLSIFALLIVCFLHYLNKPKTIEENAQGETPAEEIQILEKKETDTKLKVKNFTVTQIEDGKFKFENNFKKETPFSYAWYVINAKGEIVEKIDYGESNTFEYTFLPDDSYIVRGYVKNNKGERMYCDFAEISFHAENNQFISEAIAEQEELMPTDFEIKKLEDQKFQFICHYPKEKLFYAWYIIDASNNSAIEKIDFSDNKELTYEFDTGKSYIIRCYIKGNKEEKESVDFVKINL